MACHQHRQHCRVGELTADASTALLIWVSGHIKLINVMASFNTWQQNCVALWMSASTCQGGLAPPSHVVPVG